MTILLLMYEFFKTGLFSVGGGLATLPFLYEMSGRHPEWFSPADIAVLMIYTETRQRTQPAPSEDKRGSEKEVPPC